MIGDQSAKATDDSQIIQSQRDTNIGFSASDMKDVIVTLAQQIPHYASVAREIVDGRLQDFEAKIIARFEKSETANSQAFANPDFQYLLGHAQHSYARSGDDEAGDILVDLIARRSLETQRTRLTLSLNSAVEKSAFLTSNEFAELALCFLIRNTRRQNLLNFSELCEYLKNSAGPLVSEISEERSSYLYLASLGCASIDDSHAVFIKLMQHAYSGLLCNGFERNVFEKVLGDDFLKYDSLIIPCLHDQTKFQVGCIDKETMAYALDTHDLGNKLGELWAIQTSNLMTNEQFVEAAQKYYPEIGKLVSIWNDTPLKHLTLTAVGVAIGYANLKRVSGFDAELGAWIK